MTTRLRALPVAAKSLVAVLFAALFFVGLQAPAAHAASTSEVTVKVATKAGTPLTGLRVYAYPVEGHTIVASGVEAAFASPGVYTFTLDDALTYALYFDAPDGATTAFDQFLGGSTWVEEAEYRTFPGDTTVNVTLATNSVITGKVTIPGNKPIANVPVYPYRWDGNDWFRIDSARALTSATGVYTMRNLEPGTYRLEFAPANTTGYLTRYSGNTSVFGSAAVLTLGLGATVTHNAALVAGGSISGGVKVVIDGDDTYLPYGVTAFAYRTLSGGAIDTSRVWVSKETGTTGKWTIAALPAGTYKIKLYDTDNYGFVDVWAGRAGSTPLNPNGSSTVGGAAEYTVTLGKTTAISGTPRLIYYDNLPDTSLVITAGSLGLDADVRIFSTSGEDFFFQSDDEYGFENGTLSFPFMPVGTYQVMVAPNDGVSQPYIGTHTIAAQTGGNTWPIPLPAASAFSYSTQATVTPNSGLSVGTTLTATSGETTMDDGAAPDRPVSYSYLWLRDGSPIFGAQGPDADTYTLGGRDIGADISLIVRAESYGYRPVFSTVDLSAIAQGAAPVNSKLPVISAPTNAKPGDTFTAKPGSWNTAGLTYQYQWFFSAAGSPLAPIPGATERTWKSTIDYAGTDIAVRIGATKLGYATAFVTSPAYVPLGHLPAPVQTKASVIASTALGVDGDRRFTATAGTWAPVASTDFIWFVDGAFAEGDYATTSGAFDCLSSSSPACHPTSAVEVRVEARRDGHHIGTKTSVARKGAAAPIATPGVVTDGGTPQTATSPAVVGRTLVANAPAYTYPGTPSSVTVTYQWQQLVGSTWKSISKATKQTYVPTASDLSKKLRVRVTTSTPQWASSTVELDAGIGSLKRDLETRPALSVWGTNDPGTVKSAKLTGAWPVSGVAVTYQWFQCDPAVAVDCGNTSDPGWTPISKATAANYTPPATWTDRALRVQVTGKKTGYVSAVYSSPAFLLDDGTTPTVGFLVSGAPKMNGEVGSTVAVGAFIGNTFGKLDRTGPGQIFSTQSWQICEGLTGPCFTPSGSTTTFGQQVLFEWIDGITDPHLTLRQDVSYDGTPAAVGYSQRVPVVTGVIEEVTPRVTTGFGPGAYGVVANWSPWVDVEYRWFEGTTENVSARGDASYVPSAGTGPVWVQIDVSRDGYAPRSWKLAARKGTFVSVALPTTLDSNQFGVPLKLGAPLAVPVNPETATVKYQWFTGSTAIKGQTKATFSPSTSYIGKSVRLRVTISSPFYEPFTYFTAPVTVVKHAPATGTPGIVSSTGTVSPGATVKASLAGVTTGLTYTYTWQRRATPASAWVTVSTKSSYLIAAADAATEIRLLVKAAKTGWTTATLTSATATVQYATALDVTAPLTLSGTGKVDTLLTIAPAWNTAGVTAKYQWLRNGLPVPGATGASVTPTASWAGDDLQVIVTGTKAGHEDVTIVSNVVRVADGAAPTSAAPTVTKSGTTLTVSNGVWNVGGLTLSYAWYDSNDLGTPLPNGTSQTFSTVGYTPGTSFTAVVTATRPGYAAGSISKAYVLP